MSVRTAIPHQRGVHQPVSRPKWWPRWPSFRSPLHP